MGLASQLYVAAQSACYFANNTVVTGKIFSANNGYGFKIGKVDFLYENPNAAGGPGGTFFNIKINGTNYRID